MSDLQIISICGTLGITLLLLADIWVWNRRGVRLLRKVEFSALSLLPLLGWIIYAALRNLPSREDGSTFSTAWGGSSGWVGGDSG